MPEPSEVGVPNLAHELTVAVEAARAAGRLQLDRYQRLERIVHKSPHDVVTEVDELSERLIMECIHDAFPADAFLGEESGHTDANASGRGRKRPARSSATARGAAPGAVPEISPEEAGAEAELAPSSRLWIVDPVDGTVNYANGIPIWCVSIALAVAGRPVVGVVYDPPRDELYTAVAGTGARLDGQPVRMPVKEKLSDFVVSLSLGATQARSRGRRLGKQIRVSRVLGSAALALTWVGNGRFDAFVQPGGLSLWDVSAAGLIAAEGGALVTDANGDEWFDLARKARSVGIIAAPPEHHPTIMELLS